MLAMEHNIFTPGNYFYNGVGHVTVKYGEVLAIGFSGIKAKAQAELDKLCLADGDYQKKSRFLEAVMISCDAAIEYARRYARLALKEAEECADPVRKKNYFRSLRIVQMFRKKEQQDFMKPASPSGLYSSFCRSNPADIPFHRDDLTSICILIIRKIWKVERSQESLRRN